MLDVCPPYRTLTLNPCRHLTLRSLTLTLIFSPTTNPTEPQREAQQLTLPLVAQPQPQTQNSNPEAET